MMKKSGIILLFVILVYSFLCLTTHQYARLTGDSMLYFSIAEKYLAGDFQNAVNGYWGPFLAWLIVPFLYFGASDVFTINAINLIFGISTIIGIWMLSDRFALTENIKCVVLVCLLPIVLKFSLVQPMDFILVCFLVFYLAIVFNGDYPKKTSSGLFSGILGALAYFTKAYALPFFIVHFFIMNIFHYMKNVTEEGRRRVMKNAFAGFALFFLISGIWIMIISDKYDHFTFSTMRDTNFNAPGPEVVGTGLEFGVPVFYEGFYEPPNETAFVVWEDPSYLRGKSWSALQSFAHFKHFIKLTIRNIIEGLRIFESFSTLSIAIIIGYILLLCLKRKNELLSQGVLLYPLFTLILFSGGYLLFHFEERYVWLVNILLLLMGGHVLTVLFKQNIFESDLRKNILIGFFVVSFILFPARLVLQTGQGSMDMDMHDLSIELERYNIKGNFASSRESGHHEAWHKTFRMAYWLDSRYYGQRGEGSSDEDLENDLNKYNIDYYFIWGESNDVPQFLSRYKEVTDNKITGLKIFSLRDRGSNLY